MFPNSEKFSRALVPSGDTPAPSAAAGERQATISELVPYFLAWARVELRLSPETVVKYADSLKQILRVTGDMAPQALRIEHVLLVKAHYLQRGLSEARTASLIFALRSFLKFCRLRLGIATIDPKEIRPPRIPKREVVYLTPEEVEQFVAAIPIKKSPRSFNLRWLCFRALVEVMLGTGMRLSEALSLTRSAVDLAAGESTIIGKGGRQRRVYFSPRSLNWLKEYLTRRRDSGEALFALTSGKRLERATAVTWFGRFRKMAGIKKKVSSHTLRHSFATRLLFNGCPIGHIKELLGHEHLITTCHYYLGTDKRAAREAHRRFLDYEIKSPAAE